MKDRAAVESCFVELQDFSRLHDPRLPSGDCLSAAYVERLERQCERHEGAIYLAELEGAVVGYVCVLAQVPADEAADGVLEEARVVDLVVLPAARGRGAGRLLLDMAERHARERGAHWLRVAVFAWNDGALSMYENKGFARHEVVLEKSLAAPAESAPRLRAAAAAARVRGSLDTEFRQLGADEIMTFLRGDAPAPAPSRRGRK